MIIKRSKDFEPAPEGLHRGVCVDHYTTLVKGGQFDATPTDKLKLVFELAATMSDGRQFIATTPLLGLSLHPKSNLSKLLDGWGMEVGDEFDTELIIARPALCMVKHREASDGRIFADVSHVLPLPEGSAPLSPSGNYVRRKDRTE